MISRFCKGHLVWTVQARRHKLYLQPQMHLSYMCILPETYLELDIKPDIPVPTRMEWKMEHNMLVHLLTTKEAITGACLSLVASQCKTWCCKNPCGCRKAGFQCTINCHARSSSSLCHNVHRQWIRRDEPWDINCLQEFTCMHLEIKAIQRQCTDHFT